MDNDIKKIILSLDEANNFIGMIIIKTKSIEKYGYGNISYNELMNLYSNYATLLKKKYEKELYGLSDIDSINKLNSMKIIEYSRENLITKIVIYNENEENETIIIEDLKTTKILKLKDFDDKKEYFKLKNNYLVSFGKLLDLTQEELVQKNLLIKKVDYKKGKFHNLIIKNKKILSSILAGSIVLTSIGIGVVYFKHSEKNTSNDKLTHGKKNVVGEFEPSFKSYSPKKIKLSSANDTLEIKEVDSITLPEEKKEISDTYTSNLTITQGIIFNNKLFTHNVEAKNSKTLGYTMSENKYYIYDDKLIENMTELNEKNKSRMNYIASSYKSKTNFDSNLLTLIYYENFLDLTDENIESKAFLKYFSQIANEIVMRYKLEEEIDELVQLNTLETLKIIRDKEPLKVTINGIQKEIYYDDLPTDVKNLLINIIWYTNGCLDTKINFNNRDYTNFDIYYFLIKEQYQINDIEKYLNNEELNNNTVNLEVLKDWKEKFQEFISKFEAYINSNEIIENDLQISFNNYYTPYKSLSLDNQKSYVLNNYITENDPFTTRFSQGNDGYGRVSFEGSTIRKSGCGICAFASGVSCALSKEYDQNIAVNPEKLLNELANISNRHYYRTSSGLAWDEYSSVISKDLTESFSDLSIIELVGSEPTFNSVSLERITKYYPVVVSLNGRHHFVCITKSIGENQFIVADSDRGYSSPIKINTYIVRSDGKKRGTISGKKAWIIVPNKNIKIKDNELYIDNLDLSLIPQIGSFQTNGQSYGVMLNRVTNGMVTSPSIMELTNGIKM